MCVCPDVSVKSEMQVVCVCVCLEGLAIQGPLLRSFQIPILPLPIPSLVPAGDLCWYPRQHGLSGVCVSTGVHLQQTDVRKHTHM